MGTKGVVPKRSVELRRRNLDSKPETVKASGGVSIPAVPKEEHPIARRWYLSLRKSGQSQYFEPSDWAAALLVAHEMTQLLEGRFSGDKFASVWSAMNDLLTTEASRRRARIEVERVAPKADVPAGVADLEAFKKRMAK